MTHSVINYGEGRVIPNSELFKLPVDILIPGARSDTISMENVQDIKAKLIVEAANIPATKEVETILFQRDILVVPDIVANAGGIIAGAVEYRGGTEEEAFSTIKDKIIYNTQQVMDSAIDQQLPPRDAAVKTVKERLLN